MHTVHKYTGIKDNGDCTKTGIKMKSPKFRINPDLAELQGKNL